MASIVEKAKEAVEQVKETLLSKTEQLRETLAASGGVSSHHQQPLGEVDEAKLKRLYPDFTKEDDAEVHPSLDGLYDDLLRIREDLLCIYRDAKRGNKHDEKLRAVRVRLDNIENQAKGGDRKYNWTGPPSKDIPSGQGVINDLIEQCRSLERRIRIGDEEEDKLMEEGKEEEEFKGQKGTTSSATQTMSDAAARAQPKARDTMEETKEQASTMMGR